MVDRLVAFIDDQVLLTDVGDVGRLRVLREQVVIWLLLSWPDRLRDRLVPFVAIGEGGVDVENDATEVEDAVTDDFSDGETGPGHVDFLSHGTQTFKHWH